MIPRKCYRTLFGGGFNFAIWQSVGKSEYFMDRLHILEIGFARIFAPDHLFKIFLKDYVYQQLYLYSYSLVNTVQGLQ